MLRFAIIAEINNKIEKIKKERKDDCRSAELEGSMHPAYSANVARHDFAIEKMEELKRDIDELYDSKAAYEQRQNTGHSGGISK